MVKYGVRILKNIPKFVTSDLTEKGPYFGNDIVNMEKGTAILLAEKEFVSIITKKPLPRNKLRITKRKGKVFKIKKAPSFKEPNYIKLAKRLGEIYSPTKGVYKSTTTGKVLTKAEIKRLIKKVRIK